MRHRSQNRARKAKPALRARGWESMLLADGDGALVDGVRLLLLILPGHPVNQLGAILSGFEIVPVAALSAPPAENTAS